MIDNLRALARSLRERLAAHASGHIENEREAVELVGLADELVVLLNRLAAVIVVPATPVADAALREANELAVVIGQYQSRMFGVEEYHARLAQHGRTLRRLLNAAGYVAPGAAPLGEDEHSAAGRG